LLSVHNKKKDNKVQVTQKLGNTWVIPNGTLKTIDKCIKVAKQQKIKKQN
jgi:hypothetical protein